MATQEEARSLKAHALTLCLCHECKLLQLREHLNPDEIYQSYRYRSSVTSGLADYYAHLANRLIAEYKLEPIDLVVDVGSNDGLALLPFARSGLRILGVEPSLAARSAETRGIPTIQSFLTPSVVAGIRREFGLAKLVSANYVAANVSDPEAFLSSLGSLVDPEGAISIVTGYHPDQLAINMFEYINHDHLSYFSVSALDDVARRAGLTLVSVERVEHKGGSIRATLRCGDGVHQVSPSVNALKQREMWLRDGHAETYANVAIRVIHVREQLEHLLAKDQVLLGVGASISTTHLIHQFDLGMRIERLFDDDQAKIGTFSPGIGIPVEPIDALVGAKEPVLILAWQHTTRLLERLRQVGFHGKIVIPLPEPSVIFL